jgi:hypothetical protein
MGGGSEPGGRSPPSKRTTSDIKTPSRQAAVDDVSEEPDQNAGESSTSAPPGTGRKSKGREEYHDGGLIIETISSESQTEGSPVLLPQQSY